MKGHGNQLDVSFSLHPSPTRTFQAGEFYKFLTIVIIIIFLQGLSDVNFDHQATLPPMGFSTIPVLFVVDGIAQEGTEYAILRMSLDSSTVLPDGSFFNSDVELIIYDMDCK